MSTALFHCGTTRRRQRVADATIDTGGGVLLNGIDFLEVIDREALDPALRQRLLHLTFIRDDGVIAGGVALLGPGNFALSGGTRVTGIAVQQVTPLADGRTLELLLSEPGDYSTYALAVQATVDNPEPPPFIDRQLARVEFSFKVECPAPFDCEAPTPPVAPRAFGPPSNYLAKDYTSFRQQMLDRMAATLPGWVERAPADLGVALVETLAHGADQTSWFQDAVSTEAFLGRARLRQSVERHARMLGYASADSCNARVAVAIDAALDRSSVQPPLIAKGTRLLTLTPDATGTIAPVLPVDADKVEAEIDRGACVFETLEPVHSLAVARNAISFHDWGNDFCCLATGSTRGWLVGKRAALGLAAGDLLLFEEMIPFGGTVNDPPDPAHRQCVRLVSDPVDMRDAVLGVDIVQIDWFEDDALRFPLNIASAGGTPGALARGNIVLADEGRTLDFTDPLSHPEDAVALARAGGTGLQPDRGPGTRERLRLAVDNLVYAAGFGADANRKAPAGMALAPADAEVRAQVKLSGDGTDWVTMPDLLSSDRFAAHIKVEGDRGSYAALFGDGTMGRRPTDTSRLKARLRQGGGQRGNVAAEAIRRIVSADPDMIAGIRNPLPGIGGREAESVTAIRIAAPQDFKRQRRAVTLDDYVAAAQSYPSVQRVHAERRWTGSWLTVFLAVDRRDNLDVTPEFETGLRAHLANRRLAGHDLEVTPPLFVPLDIRLFCCVCADHFRSDVERALRDSFSAGYTQAGTMGYFHPDRFSFGDNILLSPIIARAMAIPGVAWIGTRDGSGTLVGHFGRADQPDLEFEGDAEIPIASAEVARIDSDPNHPERGRIRFDMAGGR
ncbi:baseplate J/gp47 family protein [Sphingomonas sp. SUN039]|uniref:baseplate J/gp47 family protein n=1 Tax=Sphingomonas sp. SUN039 TaxID=2937787 RepID=UPI00216483AE|nr:baseplate J/gp47 family protein [Sphingomonas sp. SUN039]UVO55692.1 baseplate J/gp47 family protein [Sphingomonas sp. SUN039]